MKASPVSPKAARDQSDGRRAELIEAAYSLIAERGLEGLRTRDIAARVGINIATLHYYFSSKETLIVAVVEHMNQLFRTLSAPEPAQPLSVIETTIRNLQYRRKVAPELSVVLMELGMRANRDPAIAGAIASLHANWRAQIEAELRAEIESGALRDDLDARAAAAILTSFVIGSSLQLQVNQSAFSVDSVLRHLESCLRADGTKPKTKSAGKRAPRSTR